MLDVRAAISSDYGHFSRLFPELATGDPVPPRERFEREIMPTTFLAETDGEVVGCAYYQVLGELAFLRVIIVDPGIRRRGVGARLMAAFFERARAAGARRACLNVMRHNTAAIRLYEGEGFTAAHRTVTLKLDWNALPSPAHAPLATQTIAPADDTTVERELGLMPHLLADARTKPGRVLRCATDEGRLVAAAVFDPAFPGAYPFKVTDARYAVPFLSALRPYARPEHAYVQVVVEGQPSVSDALLEAGAALRHEIQHMVAPVPSAPGESVDAEMAPSAHARHDDRRRPGSI